MKTEKIALAALATVTFLTAITIAAEVLAPLKAWLASTFYHHWIGKGVLGIALFGLTAFWGLPVPLNKLEKLATPLIALCTLALFAFFTLHYLKAI